MNLLSGLSEAVGFQVMFYGGIAVVSLMIAGAVWFIMKH